VSRVAPVQAAGNVRQQPAVSDESEDVVDIGITGIEAEEVDTLCRGSHRLQPRDATAQHGEAACPFLFSARPRARAQRKRCV